MSKVAELKIKKYVLNRHRRFTVRDWELLLENTSRPFFLSGELLFMTGLNYHTFKNSLKRAVEKGVLEKIFKGVYRNMLYSEETCPEEAALFIADPVFKRAYISMEYALAFYGLLRDSHRRVITIMTPAKNYLGRRNFSFEGRVYTFEVHRVSANNIHYITEVGDIRIASPEKAFVDLVHIRGKENFQKLTSLMKEVALEGIDFSVVEDILKKGRYPSRFFFSLFSNPFS